MERNIEGKKIDIMLAFIGKIVMQLREEQSLTVEELAERAGVSIEKIKGIEASTIMPSVGVMIKISRALGSRLGTLLDGQESQGAVVARRSQIEPTEHISTGKAVGGAARHMEFFALGQGKKDRAMEPLLVEVRPHTAIDEVRSEHEGEEFVYVLEGSIEVYYGAERHVLEAGDSIIYDSIVPHAIVSATPETAKILAVVYTPY